MIQESLEDYLAAAEVQSKSSLAALKKHRAEMAYASSRELVGKFFKSMLKDVILPGGFKHQAYDGHDTSYSGCSL